MNGGGIEFEESAQQAYKQAHNLNRHAQEQSDQTSRTLLYLGPAIIYEQDGTLAKVTSPFLAPSTRAWRSLRTDIPTSPYRGTQALRCLRIR